MRITRRKRNRTIMENNNKNARITGEKKNMEERSKN
jgi:hypothetical protein